MHHFENEPFNDQGGEKEPNEGNNRQTGRVTPFRRGKKCMLVLRLGKGGGIGTCPLCASKKGRRRCTTT